MSYILNSTNKLNSGTERLAKSPLSPDYLIKPMWFLILTWDFANPSVYLKALVEMILSIPMSWMDNI